MRWCRWSAVAAAVVLLLSLAGGAGAATPAQACRSACATRNVPASCRWLAAHPAACVRTALRSCRALVRAGAAAGCPAPADLPPCASNHACPFGALCTDGACQVVPCTADGSPPCAGHQACRHDRCVVADCEGVTDNCPAGLHCVPGDGPIGALSGTCVADDPGTTYCTTNVDCIAPGEPRRVCVRGTCVRRGRHRKPPHRGTGSTTTTTTTVSSTTTTTTGAPACADVFDCAAASQACCQGHCVADPYAGQGTCSTVYTPACTLCHTDGDCHCNGIFCDTCGGTASLSGCVDPCAP